MAYGAGYPMNYQPQQYVPQQYMNPYQQPQQNNGGIIWVQGEAGAKSYLVQPNNTVQLWDSEEQVIYLKSADASGMPTIRIFEYREREHNQNKQAEEANKQEYVTKADLEEFGDRIIRQLSNGTYKRKYNNGDKFSKDDKGE